MGSGLISWGLAQRDTAQACLIAQRHAGAPRRNGWSTVTVTCGGKTPSSRLRPFVGHRVTYRSHAGHHCEEGCMGVNGST